MSREDPNRNICSKSREKRGERREEYDDENERVEKIRNKTERIMASTCLGLLIPRM